MKKLILGSIATFALSFLLIGASPTGLPVQHSEPTGLPVQHSGPIGTLGLPVQH